MFINEFFGKKKVETVAEGEDNCPPATQDIALNLENRKKAIDEYGYGPLNPALPNTKFWMHKVNEWNLDSADEAKQSLCGNCAAFDIRQNTLGCIAQGIDSSNPEDAASVIDAGDLGYCKFLKFKCASQRTCDAWVTGGPLTDEQGVAEGQDDNGISFQIQKGKNKFATTLSIGNNSVGVYQYDANTGRSIAEVYPEFKGKGLGKLLVLHAIYTAAKLGLDFQEDESRTSEYDNVLDSLSGSGYIVDDEGYWYVTGEGEQFLKQSLKQGVAEGLENNMSTEDMIAYLRQHHDKNPHPDYLNHINTFSKFVLTDIPVDSIKTELPGLDKEKVEQYKKMDFSKAPPIVMGDGYILDGYHRTTVAKALGIPTIKGYVGVKRTQNITELFDQSTALPLEWERMPGPSIQGVKSKDELYATAYDKDGRTININFVPMRNGIVDISFNRGGSMDITGKGAAAQIFATVVDAINRYIKTEKPVWISFSASEPSRAKLYQHMVKRLSGAYELLTPDQYPADGDLENAQEGAGTFFLLRKRA